MKKLLILLNLFFLLNITFAADQNLPFEGRWDRNSSDNEFAYLYISQATVDSFRFSLVAGYYGRLGSVEDGAAYISDGCANFSGENGAKLKFCFKDNKIIITQNGKMGYYAGLGVAFNGEYVKDDSVTPLMTAVQHQDFPFIKRMIELDPSQIHAVDQRGLDAIYHAEHSGNPNKEEIVKYLRTILSPTKK